MIMVSNKLSLTVRQCFKDLTCLELLFLLQTLRKAKAMFSQRKKPRHRIKSQFLTQDDRASKQWSIDSNLSSLPLVFIHF